MKQYNEQFDAYYDDETNEWLESKCNDPECEYCVNRPVNPPQFKRDDRVMVMPLNIEATVIKQMLCFDYPDSFWGNVELIYDDGVKGISNSWQLKKL